MKKTALAALSAAWMTFYAPSAGRTEQDTGYLLNMYHFNIQYVVGSEASMRRIVKQSFEPLVDFYVEHPRWGADFEMQGMMIEYMAQRHPEVLDKFRRIVNSGQVELVTFHYADQLLLAFPAHDQEWSIRINDKALERNNIKRSGVVFAQEAQFGEGMAWLGNKHGYRVVVMTTGTYGWFQDMEEFPYYTVNGMDVLVDKDAVHEASGIKVRWRFLGDGELVATAGISPYFPGLFRKNPLKLKRLELAFQKAEKEGYKPATVTEYLDALRRAGVGPTPLKPVLDSPWRPGDGSGVFQWMGRYSLPWEKDWHVRTRNWQVRNMLVEAEREAIREDALEAAWAFMVNAQVSDPTGWYPLPVEINWDYRQMDKAERSLLEAGADLDRLKNLAAERPKARPMESAPVRIRLFGAAEDADAAWAVLEDRPACYSLELSWTGRGDGGVAFPWTAAAIEYSPAMMEHVVRVIPKDRIKGKNIHLGLPNGLIKLDEAVWLVRDNAAGCVAAGLYFDRDEVVFEVNKGREESYAFRFYLLTGTDADEALEFANSINRTRP